MNCNFLCRRVTEIIGDFSRDWKKSLDSINGEILSSFPNLKLGTSLLQQAGYLIFPVMTV